ncbi:hypothetical protein AVEN_97364-1 [Araneus ventricosus]|uniref:Uncharacterized protein n=1 Tax=Araneus ventricosus TaxID=182803 RepID=A0A4Y2JE89_ARAVE|nr:hypothetical protein AVEN_97364-1 [Araneus ventricosus]
MASLPPSEAATHHHSLRIYHQIQRWLCNKREAPRTRFNPGQDILEVQGGMYGKLQMLEGQILSSNLCLCCWDTCNTKKTVFYSDYFSL